MKSSTRTNNILITASPEFDNERSRPDVGLFVYKYHIEIKNESTDTVQLLARHWLIKDGFDHVEEVRGPGVVGKTPVLRSGEDFHYTSFCPLPTPSGSMQGSFEFKDSANKHFEAKIDVFYFNNSHLVN